LNLPASALLSYLRILHNNGWIARTDVQVEILAGCDLTTEKRDQAERMVRSIFGKSYDEYLWGRNDWYILVHVNGVLACHITITDRIVRVGPQGEHNLRVGGIGGVATLPEFRGRGLASLAMNRAAAFMRAQYAADFGLLVCSEILQPFYSGLGWLPISDPMTYDQPGRKIQNEGPLLYLPCRQANWPSGPVDLNGFPW
jgi:aminoglycoside 2'-N-acetyltransferase I